MLQIFFERYNFKKISNFFNKFYLILRKNILQYLWFRTFVTPFRK